MSKVFGKIRELYLRMVGSIAFWPSLITVLFLTVAAIVLVADTRGINAWLIENLGLLAVSNADNARLVLGTLAGGTISLTVFSFTMVMVVLNQAGSNLSPRVIPGLITQRAHQVVLGFYLGTTLYLLLLILGFQEGQHERVIPVGGILLALLFGIVCLVLFVYFIHSISQAVQVNAVLSDIYRDGLVRFDEGKESKVSAQVPLAGGGIRFACPQSAYITQVDLRQMAKLAHENDLEIILLGRVGNFTQKGEPVVELTGIGDNETLKEKILSMFSFSQSNVSIEDTEITMKRISEIGVRALSPGINDPGTAITALDMLTGLLLEEMKQPQYTVVSYEGRGRIFIPCKPFDVLLVKYWVPIRHYGRDNVGINLKLRYNLETLLKYTPPHCKSSIEDELTALRQSYELNIELPQDRRKLENAEREIAKRLNPKALFSENKKG